MHTSDEEYFNSLLKKPTVFKDIGCLSVTYIPPYLPHREEELRTLAKCFKTIFDNQDGPIPQRAAYQGQRQAQAGQAAAQDGIVELRRWAFFRH